MDWEAILAGGTLALAGAAIGYGFRVREAVRGERAAAYLELLTLIDQFPLDYVAAGIKGDLEVALAKEQELEVGFTRAHTKIALIASSGVLNALDAVFDALRTDDFGRAGHDLVMGSGSPHERAKAFSQRFETLTSEARDQLLSQMRKDLQGMPARFRRPRDAN